MLESGHHMPKIILLDETGCVEKNKCMVPDPGHVVQLLTGMMSANEDGDQNID